jgi:predicted dehydrogenase
LKQAAAIGVGLAASGLSSMAAGAPGTTPPSPQPSSPPQTGKSVARLVAPKLDVVRIGIIGVGGRGTGDLAELLACEGVQIKAICDLVPEKVEYAKAMVVKKGQAKPDGYSNGPEDFKHLCDRQDIDLVYIATPWNWHVPMCVDAMNKGKHAVTEVPAAVTLDECWQLVDTAEATQKHCMILENCCYGPEELMVLNMVRKGLFGDVLHGECAYLHDLRAELFSGHGEGSWRINEHVNRDGNLYPTHGLGPVAQYMNINRGDRFDYLVSLSSPSMGLQQYEERLKDSNPWKHGSFKCGDMNTSIIKTAMGRTIMVQHDVSNPHPYSRINLIKGTKGMFRGYPDRIYVEGRSKGEAYESLDSYKEYTHPLWAKLQSAAVKNGGHGGMDYVLNWRLIQCLREGLPLDIDVYDTAAWSAVSALSEKSVASRGAPIDFPDFTRGGWKTNPPLEIVA